MRSCERLERPSQLYVVPSASPAAVARTGATFTATVRMWKKAIELADNELNVKAIVKELDGVIEARNTAERILKSLLRRQNEVEFALGEAWTFRFDGPTTFVPEFDADLAYLNKLIGD